jgi:hypothetical protein
MNDFIAPRVFSAPAIMLLVPVDKKIKGTLVLSRRIF